MKQIEDIFLLEQWEKVQDSLADLTGMAILMVDYRGVPVTKHSNCCSFCQKVREDPILKKYCEKCDSRGGAEAVRENRPYIYQCCFGLIDAAIPIVLQNVYLGALMIGQVRTERKDLENIVALPEHRIIKEHLTELQQYYEEIPVLDYGQICKYSETLSQLCQYMVENKEIEKKTEEKAESEKEEMNVLKESSFVSQAKDYVRNHLEDDVTLTETARNCAISPSYLSRVFVKETGQCFSLFVSEEKIKKAKEWLENQEMSVSEIGDRLGFNETGYFIKIFKRNVGMTPGMYRKYRKNADSPIRKAK